jgi:uncharacterized membrane protein YjdF
MFVNPYRLDKIVGHLNFQRYIIHIIGSKYTPFRLHIIWIESVEHEIVLVGIYKESFDKRHFKKVIMFTAAF